jgi:hypothetical protein
MNVYFQRQWMQLKKDISEFKELSNYQTFIIKNLTKQQHIEIILLYDEMIGGLRGLTDYEELKEEQKSYISVMKTEERVELIFIYNKAIIDINTLIN